MALRIRALFAGFGLESFAKTSGSKGMQVYVPLNGELTYETTKPFSHAVARALESSEPDLVTSQMTKSLRPGKVFVDWSQNTRTKTTVAAYSLRARELPTASAPLRWDEVDGGLDPATFTMDVVLERIARDGDLLAPALAGGQSLRAALRAVGG